MGGMGGMGGYGGVWGVWGHGGSEVPLHINRRGRVEKSTMATLNAGKIRRRNSNTVLGCCQWQLNMKLVL